jgi:hypothetical protein
VNNSLKLFFFLLKNTILAPSGTFLALYGTIWHTLAPFGGLKNMSKSRGFEKKAYMVYTKKLVVIN